MMQSVDSVYRDTMDTAVRLVSPASWDTFTQVLLDTMEDAEGHNSCDTFKCNLSLSL